ncbi:MAG: S8 family serine peptidase [Bdellovibrionales bacterium]|nr:S8 family serine peptidase [Bdellovibrionales bacterium]
MFKFSKIFFYVALLGSIACSKRAIVLEANKNLDPLPSEKETLTQAIDPLVKDQWNMDKLGMQEVWQNNHGLSRRVIVAVLGTGVDYTHEDLAGNIYVNNKEWSTTTPGKQNAVDRIDNDDNGYVDDFIGYDFVDNDGLPYDKHGSGTAIAGIIGAVGNNNKGIRGIVPEVSLLPVRFIDGSGQFHLPNLISAVDYALKMKADVILVHTPSHKLGYQSFGGYVEEYAQIERLMLTELIAKIDKAQTPVVLSAGSSGLNLEKGEDLISVLKRSPNVIVVTSVNESEKRPAIANFGRQFVETSAPGENVVTTFPGNSYKSFSNTAIAAAHVAGALALAVNKHFGKIPTKSLLTAFVNPQASDAIQDLEFETIGGNRLNISKYLSFLDTL